MEEFTSREVSLLAFYQIKLIGANSEDVMEAVTALCQIRQEGKERQEIINMIQEMIDTARKKLKNISE